VASWPLWLGVGVVVAVLAGWAWLAERARRATLVALVSQAPAGTVVVQDRGLGGPAMALRLGAAAADEGEGGGSEQAEDFRADSR
jgi:hypothetical protein